MEWILMNVIISFAIGLVSGAFIGLIIIRKISLILKEESRNKVHFYVARDKNGKLYLYLGKPRRSTVFFISFVHPSDFICHSDRFYSFGLNENDYANLKWEDDPVEVFVNMDH